MLPTAPFSESLACDLHMLQDTLTFTFVELNHYQVPDRGSLGTRSELTAI